MNLIKKFWNFYTVKLALVLCITSLISYTTKLYILSGTICIALTIFYFAHSFKDPAFKSKKTVTKIFIYIFLVFFLIAGFLALSGPSGSDIVRNQIFSSTV